MPALYTVVNSSDLGNDWRPEAHIRVEGLLLFQWRRVQEIKKLRDEYRRRIAKLDEEECAIIAQREEVIALVPNTPQ